MYATLDHDWKQIQSTWAHYLHNILLMKRPKHIREVALHWLVSKTKNERVDHAVTFGPLRHRHSARFVLDQNA